MIRAESKIFDQRFSEQLYLSVAIKNIISYTSVRKEVR
ncbi:hypothetical protein CK1_24590 [Ruminococcus sp. SR1/5]|nr:hypothetical protein CK1_24590 [Ruminococcus sp. SR1/5]